MKALKYTAVFVLGALGLASLAQAQTHNYDIEIGTVSVTPAFCIPEACEPRKAELSGTFEATINGKELSFAEIEVTSTPNVGFNLPKNPNESSNGTTREATFEWVDGVLSVKGRVDSRAFDGPLYEYSFQASQSQPSGVDAQGYYSATQDLRKCASPLCGGIFVKAVNKRTTACPDGTRKKQCYIGTANWDKLGFNPFEHAGPTNLFTPLLLKGDIVANSDGAFGNLGEFIAEAAYRPATNNPVYGRFVALDNKGIYCITSPCFSIDQYYLNLDKQRVISGFDLNPTGATADDEQAAYEEFGNGRPIFAVGYNKKRQELHGVGIWFIADQFYLPIEPKKTCDEGYSWNGEKCLTALGCEAPQLDLTTIGGAPMVDPETGELIPNITYSCIDSCDFPAHMSGPASCTLALP